MLSVFFVVNVLQAELCMEFCSVAAGAASVSVAGATPVGGLATWVAGVDADTAGATSPMLDVSCLTASG